MTKTQKFLIVLAVLICYMLLARYHHANTSSDEPFLSMLIRTFVTDAD